MFLISAVCSREFTSLLCISGKYNWLRSPAQENIYRVTYCKLDFDEDFRSPKGINFGDRPVGRSHMLPLKSIISPWPWHLLFILYHQIQWVLNSQDLASKVARLLSLIHPVIMALLFPPPQSRVVQKLACWLFRHWKGPLYNSWQLQQTRAWHDQRSILTPHDLDLGFYEEIPPVKYGIVERDHIHNTNIKALVTELAAHPGPSPYVMPPPTTIYNRRAFQLL